MNSGVAAPAATLWPPAPRDTTATVLRLVLRIGSFEGASDKGYGLQRLVAASLAASGRRILPAGAIEHDIRETNAAVFPADRRV
jgi:hypothetical protein